MYILSNVDFDCYSTYRYNLDCGNKLNFLGKDEWSNLCAIMFLGGVKSMHDEGTAVS